MSETPGDFQCHSAGQAQQRITAVERVQHNLAWMVLFLLVACYLVFRALFTKGILTGRDLIPSG